MYNNTTPENQANRGGARGRGAGRGAGRGGKPANQANEAGHDLGLPLTSTNHHPALPQPGEDDPDHVPPLGQTFRKSRPPPIVIPSPPLVSDPTGVLRSVEGIVSSDSDSDSASDSETSPSKLAAWASKRGGGRASQTPWDQYCRAPPSPSCHSGNQCPADNKSIGQMIKVRKRFAAHSLARSHAR